MLMDSYRQYFLHQCQTHPLLLHTDDKKVFGMISIEESFGDFVGEVKSRGFIFRLIEYTYRPGLNNDGRYTKNHQGGFLIAKSYDERGGGEAARLAASDEAEGVSDDFVAKMIADSIAGHPLWQRSLDGPDQITTQGIGLTGDATYIGWRTMFTWENQFRDCIPSNQDPDWMDGGLTPY